MRVARRDLVLAHVGRVEHRLGGEQVEARGRPAPPPRSGTTARAGRPAASASRTRSSSRCSSLACGSPDLAVRAVLSSRFSTLARSASPSSMLMTSRSRTGIDGAHHVLDVGILEAAHHVNDRVDFADVGQELVAQPFALAGALDQAGDVQELDRRRARSARGSRCSRQRVEPRDRAPGRCRYSARWWRTG